MSKFTKRLLCVLAAVIAVIALSLMVFAEQGQQVQGPECYEHGDVNGDGVIDNKDAIYILYRYLFDDDQDFPIDQIWDYNEDGKQDNKDAIYVLYHYMFEDDEDFKLKGTIHDYYDPTWSWNEETATAQVTFKCGCGQQAVYTAANGVSVAAGEKVDATCVKAGSQKYTAAVTVDGQTYTNEYTKLLPAGQGHAMVGTQDCENGSHCANCEYKTEPLGHSWKLDSSVKATCTQNAYELYRCSACGDTDQKVLEGTAGHSMQYDREVRDGCKVTKWYSCTGCSHTAAGTAETDVYYEHSYTAALTREATCVSKGVKTYSCGNCSDSYTEDVDINDSHDWVEGATANGVTTHSCSRSGCQATKTTVAVTKDTAITNDDLRNELQLQNDASMKLDEKTVAGLDQEKTVKVSVELVDPEQTGLSAQQQAQVGNAKVYDFSMKYDDGTPVSNFEGQVTISLPYTLEDGEDVDSINVWYIDDNGDPTAVKATYSNGFVTFTTGHFSYYTVTRLTPAERCALYGHVKVSRTKAVTCTEDGYDTELCSRCGEVFKNDVKAHAGHSFQKTVTKAADCVNNGTFRESCANCSAAVSGVIPATGHAMQADSTQSVAASCQQAGKDVYVCANGCGHTQEIAKAQLSHNYKAFENTQPDCENKGVQTKKCQLCGDVVTVQETLPLGHSFETDNAIWTWSDDHLSATVTLTCSHNRAHTKVLTAVVTRQVTEGGCEVGAGVTYTATASHNKETFTDTYAETQTAPGHTPGTEWSSDENRHWHICQVCNEPADQDAHSWDSGKVTAEPTCGKAGTAVYTCLICGYEAERTVPATKQHSYVDGICTGCGREENACNHNKTTGEYVDLTQYGVCDGGYAIRYSCECGENVSYDYTLLCDLDYDTDGQQEVVDGITFYHYTYACADCGVAQKVVEGGEYIEGKCAMRRYTQVDLSMGDVQILSTRYNMGQQLHPPKVLVETVELTGLCGEKLSMYRCGCEEALQEPVYEDYCQWDYQGVDKQTGAEVYVCQDCGGEKHWLYGQGTHPEGSCQYESVYTVSYYLDGQLLYSFTESDLYYDHEYEVESFELLGESCTDGVELALKCKSCGATDSDYIEDHNVDLITEQIDLTDANICYTGATIRHCACGNRADIRLTETEEHSCRWGEAVESENGTDTWTCTVCGAVHINSFTETQGQGCQVLCTWEDTYKDAQGNVLLTWAGQWTDTNHDYEITETKLKSDNCQDGGWVKRVCKDCGDFYITGVYYHETFASEQVELGCGGTAVLASCLCGREAYIEWQNQSCLWTAVKGDADEGYQMVTYRCEACGGMYRQEVTTQKVEGTCRIDTVTTYSFYKDQQAEAADDAYAVLTAKRVSYDHDMKAVVTLNDPQRGCEGGYTVDEICTLCGDRDQYYYSEGAGHNQFRTAKTKLSADGQLCCDVYQVSYSCPCGKQTSQEVLYENGECNWRWAGDAYLCETCQTVMRESYQQTEVEGSTCQQQISWTYTFLKDDQTLFTACESWITENHRDTVVYNLYGQTCDEGYEMTYTCQDCGETRTAYSSGCMTRAVEYRLLADHENACSPVWLVHSRCACGQYDNWGVEGDCRWYGAGSDGNGNEIRVCGECGMKWTCAQTRERVENSCQYLITREDTFTLGDKTCSATNSYTSTEHKTVAVLTPNGDSCDNGYTGYWQCSVCGVMEGTINGMGHATYAVAEYDLADYGMCGGYVRKLSCACGKESEWGWNLNYCQGTGTGKIDPDTGMMEYYCQQCGSFYSWGQDGQVNHDTCTFEGWFRFKLRNAQETLLNLQGQYQTVQHDTYISNAVLMYPNSSCEDGVTVTWQCRHCSYNWTDVYYSHRTAASVNIETACGGYARIEQCACGQEQNVRIWCEDMRSTSRQETDDQGVEHYYNEDSCATCGLYALRDTTKVPLEGCQVQENHSYLIRYDGQEYTFSYSSLGEKHSFGDATVSLLPGSVSCEDGAMISRVCTACGEVDSWTTTSHELYNSQVVDLTLMGACQGKYQLNSCACGTECRFEYVEGDCAYYVKSWNQVDESGISHYYELYRCNVCGLEITTDSYDAPTDDPCYVNYITNKTLTCGGTTQVLTTRYKASRHTYVRTATLVDPNGTCLDGVRVVETCRNCDYYSSWTGEDHYTQLEQSLPLSQFGAVCGGSLEHYVCPCGASEDWRFSEDAQCDVNESETVESWIQGDLDAYQSHIMNDGSAYTYCYRYRCAVTDPEACGLNVRFATYWVKDPDKCQAVQYEQWLLGYDDATGTYQQKLEYATGQVKSWHDFTRTEIEETDADGNRVSGYRDTCADCGSVYSYVSTSKIVDDREITVRLVREFTSTLDNGERKYYNNTETYAEIAPGVYAWVCNRYDYIQADGTATWEQRDYAYDLEACQRTITYSGFNMSGSSYTEAYHVSYTAHREQQDATCSQPGYERYWEECNSCGKTIYNNDYEYEPGHSWNWDSGAQQYVCGRCGLYSVSGSDGDIVLEDLTQKYGMETEYVVGYYNPKSIGYVLNLSVILDDAQGDGQISLDFSDFSYKDTYPDGYQGVSFNKEAAHAAAAAAVPAGYEGTYAIRISFVPVGGSTLDYAITFDSVQAQ